MERKLLSETNIYLISVIIGTNPDYYQKTSKGFVESTTKEKAIAQAAKYLQISHTRLVAETKTESGSAWEIEREMFPTLPKSV